MPILYDKNGNKIRFDDLKKEVAPALTGVRSIWNDSVVSGLTPQRLAAILAGAAQGDHFDYLTLAEEMEERDPHYGCEIGKRKLAVSRLPVIVESASNNTRDIKLADAVRNMVKKAGFRWLLKDLLDALGKGFSAVEIIWDRSGEVWCPKRYEHRDPHWFTWDLESMRKLRLLNEKNITEGIDLPPYKFIIHTPRIKSGIPIRSGFARLSAWAYMCKGYAIKDWLAFAEVFGMPLRLGKYRPGATKEDIDVLKMAVSNLGTDAAAIFPEGMEIELKEVSKRSSTDFFERLAQFFDDQVTKGILGQTATTQGTPGKLGNESAQEEVRYDIRDDDAGQLEATLQRDLIIPFIDLNYGPQQKYPSIKLFAKRKGDMTALTDALAKLVPLGLQVECSVVRDLLGLPDPAPGAKILGAVSAPTIAENEYYGEAANEMLSDWVMVGSADTSKIDEALEIGDGPFMEIMRSGKKQSDRKSLAGKRGVL
jgi:phage gp29-like protein